MFIIYSINVSKWVQIGFIYLLIETNFFKIFWGKILNF